MTNYNACVARMPKSPWARNARRRLLWLSQHSEGNFVPLAHLRRIERDPALAGDPTAIENLAREADEFPAGTVRGEARILVAKNWLKQKDRSKDAVDELRKVLDDRSAERWTAVFAERDLVDLRLAEGHLDEAASEVQRYPLDPRLTADVQRLIHKRRLRRGATLAIAVVAGLALVLILRKDRRRRALTDVSRAAVV